MAKFTKKGAWYTGFAVILGAIGTFLITTDPIFHYHDMLERASLDSTKVVRSVDVNSVELDSLVHTINKPKVKTLSQINRDVEENKRKNAEQDSLIKKHEEILR